MADDWCEVDDLPAVICKGPHVNHRCLGNDIVTTRKGHHKSCPMCGWVEGAEVPVRPLADTESVDLLRELVRRGDVTIALVLIQPASYTHEVATVRTSLAWRIRDSGREVNPKTN